MESTLRGSFPMEVVEEESYMALNFNQRKGRGEYNFLPHVQGAPQCPQWYRVALGGAFLVILLLIGVVIILAIWVLQSKGTERLPDCEFWLQLKTVSSGYFACSSSGNSTEENITKCKICPQDWTLHRESCYWFSKQTKNWAQSQEYCRAKNSTLVVIQNEEEKEFIKNVTLNVWLGLIAKPSENGTWKWVDGSPLKTNLFVDGSAEGNSCLVKIERKFYSEDCTSTRHWICEKTALDV